MILVGGATISNVGTPCTVWRAIKDAVGGEKKKCGHRQTADGDRFRTADLLADERCSEAILEFLETADVGSMG